MLLLGLGSHCIAHALVPSEPALARLGLTPLLYGILTVLPKAGSVFTPALWGHVFARSPRLALACAPLMLAAAQALLTAGLFAYERDLPWVASPALLLGFVLSAASKAGVAVLQHACLALALQTSPPSPEVEDSSYEPPLELDSDRLFSGSGSRSSSGSLSARDGSFLSARDGSFNTDGSYATDEEQSSSTLARAPPEWSSRDRSFGPVVAGLCINVGTTHLIGAVVVFAVPHVLDYCGLIGLQFVLLTPSLLSVCGGIALGFLLPQMPPPAPPSPAPRRRYNEPFTVECSSCGALIRVYRPFKDVQTCDKCRELAAVHAKQRAAVLALGLWRAAIIGSLHAISTISVSLLTSHSLSLPAAGSLVALASAGSLLSLPLLSCAARTHTLLHSLLLVCSLAVIATTAILVLADAIGGEDSSWCCSKADMSSKYDLPVPLPYAEDDHVDIAPTTSGWLLSAGRAFAAARRREQSAAANGGADAAMMSLQADGRTATGGSSGLLCWMSRIGTIGLTLCATVTPVVPLALVPVVQPPATVGVSVGTAYGLLEAVSACGQVVVSVAAGAARQAGGFRLALRGLFCALVLSLPCTFYAQRCIVRAINAMRRVSRPRHLLLAEVLTPGQLGVDVREPTSRSASAEQLVPYACSSRVKPMARPFHVASREHSL